MMHKMSDSRAGSLRNGVLGAVCVLLALSPAFGQTQKTTTGSEAKATHASAPRVSKSPGGPRTTTDKLPRHAAVDMPAVKGSNTSQELNRLERQNLKASAQQSGPQQSGASPKVRSGVAKKSTGSAKNPPVNFPYREPKSGLTTKGATHQGRLGR